MIPLPCVRRGEVPMAVCAAKVIGLTADFITIVAHLVNLDPGGGLEAMKRKIVAGPNFRRGPPREPTPKEKAKTDKEAVAHLFARSKWARLRAISPDNLLCTHQNRAGRL